MNMRIAIVLSACALLGVVLIAGPIAAQDIHRAATSGDTASVRRMLEADPNLLELRNPWGRTPLCAAARGVFSMEAAIMAPCSVKTFGNVLEYFKLPRWSQFATTSIASSGVS